MKFGYGWCCLAALGLVSCGGASGSSSVNGTSSTSILAAPAGVATTVFMDLQLVRPDELTTGSGFPTGVTSNVPAASLAKSGAEATPAASPGVLTFTNCKAANGGYINGTIQVAVTGTTTLTYTETFNLTVTPTMAGVPSPAWNWTYIGTQTVAVTPATSTALVTTPLPYIAATYTSGTAAPVVYQFSSSLSVNWSSLQAVSLVGSFEVNRPGVESVTVTLAPPLVWDTQATPPCSYPISGTMALALDQVSPAFTDSTTVVFNSTCGEVTLGGASLNLGQ